MAKWYGKIGYAESVQTEPGLWNEQITERPYYGDLTRDSRERRNNDGVNDSVNIRNTISIISDPFAIQNCSLMVYADFMGAKWRITDVEVQYPRLILTIGGAYNGQSPSATSE